MQRTPTTNRTRAEKLSAWIKRFLMGSHFPKGWIGPANVTPGEDDLANMRVLAGINWDTRGKVGEDQIAAMVKSRDILRKYAQAFRKSAKGFAHFIKPFKASRGKPDAPELARRLTALMNALETLTPKQAEGELGNSCADLLAFIHNEIPLDGFEVEGTAAKWKVRAELE